MKPMPRPIALMAAALLVLSASATAQIRKEARFTVAPGSTLSVINMNGNVSIRPSTGGKVVITSTAQSDKVEVGSRQMGNRIDIRTHNARQAKGDETRVDYDIMVPADAQVKIDSGEGQIKVEGMRAAVDVDSESSDVEVRHATGGSVRVQSVGGNVTLTSIRQTRIQAVSTGGDIALYDVTGPTVVAKTSSGAIRYGGDCGSGGSYTFTSHSGDIELNLSSKASVDLTARSVKGAVDTDFPFQKRDHEGFAASPGRAFAGTSLTGASSVELRSFSGKIRVKKQ
ncbi:MAG: DUF4097 family beta strand repeat protein [Acidobacteriales bacterium]|nr:DUF4097 family beta strand repeat protein [Terriglobales bacterium]